MDAADALLDGGGLLEAVGVDAAEEVVADAHLVEATHHLHPEHRFECQVPVFHSMPATTRRRRHRGRHGKGLVGTRQTRAAPATAASGQSPSRPSGQSSSSPSGQSSISRSGAPSAPSGGTAPALGSALPPAFAGSSSTPASEKPSFGGSGPSSSQPGLFSSTSQQTQPTLFSNASAATSTPAFGSTRTPTALDSNSARAFGSMSTSLIGASSSPAFGSQSTSSFSPSSTHIVAPSMAPSSTSAFGGSSFPPSAFGTSAGPLNLGTSSGPLSLGSGPPFAQSANESGRSPFAGTTGSTSSALTPPFATLAKKMSAMGSTVFSLQKKQKMREQAQDPVSGSDNKYLIECPSAPSKDATPTSMSKGHSGLRSLPPNLVWKRSNSPTSNCTNPPFPKRPRIGGEGLELPGHSRSEQINDVCTGLLLATSGASALCRELEDQDQELEALRKRAEAAEASAKAAEASTKEVQCHLDALKKELDTTRLRKLQLEKESKLRQAEITHLRNIMKSACEKLLAEVEELPATPMADWILDLSKLMYKSSKKDMRFVLRTIGQVKEGLRLSRDHQLDCIADGLERAVRRLSALTRGTKIEGFPDPSLLFDYVEGEDDFEFPELKEAFRKSLTTAEMILASDTSQVIPTPLVIDVEADGVGDGGNAGATATRNVTVAHVARGAGVGGESPVNKPLLPAQGVTPVSKPLPAQGGTPVSKLLPAQGGTPVNKLHPAQGVVPTAMDPKEAA